MITYLDFNASTPIEPRVLNYMVDIYQNKFGNPNSRTHIYGADAKGIIENARVVLSDILNIETNEIIFTSGSTESSNIAILGLLDYAKKTGKNHFITTAIEHKAVLEPMKFLAQNGCVVDFIKPDISGRISADELIRKVTDKTALVSVMHVNSETGIIQPVKEIGEELRKRDIWFHIDATQSFGKMNNELRKVHYDTLSISAHKLRGPQGIGALVVRREKNIWKALKPITLGGGQERNLRPGTLPVALIGGFALAAEICENNKSLRRERCIDIKKQFLGAIEDVKYKINGDSTYCIPNTINISFDEVDSEGIFIGVKDYYAISSGSACESGSYASSYVLKAMGLDNKRMDDAVRLSWDYDTVVDFSKLVEYVKGQQSD